MSQAPSMPVFTDALIGDTLHLSAEEFGAYCLLLFATWRNNGIALRDDDEELSRICRISRYKWKNSVREKLAKFFDISDGSWHQRRLEKEWAYVQEKAEVSRKNGRYGGRPRKNPAGFRQDTQQDTQQGTQQGTQTETTQPQPHTHSKNLSQPALGVSEPREAESGSKQAGWLADFEISEIWLSEAGEARAAAGKPPIDLRPEAEKIRAYWRESPPKDPHAAWIGWALNARADRANGATPHGPDLPSPQRDRPTGPPPPITVRH